jgi:hypothetical protein
MEENRSMEQRNTSPLWWVLFGVLIVAVLGVGLWIMPRLRAATTFVPPTSTPIPPSPTAVPSSSTSDTPEGASTAPPPTVAASPLRIAPGFTLPGAGGIELTLADQLEEGPVVLAFFQRTGG